MKEKEVMTYSYLKGIATHFTECPYSHTAYRIYVRDLLNHYEDEHPGTKENVIQAQLQLKTKIKTDKKEMHYCTRCKGPSSREICQSCIYTDLPRVRFLDL